MGPFLTSGRPRGPGKAFKNVGGDFPHIFEGVPDPPGASQTSKTHPKTSGQSAFRNPALRSGQGPGPPGAGQTSNMHPKPSGQSAFRYPAIRSTVRYVLPHCEIHLDGYKVLNFLRIGNRPFWRSVRPRGPRRPLEKVGGEAPHRLEGSPGPPEPPRPPK